jgi:hypothetical protein
VCGQTEVSIDRDAQGDSMDVVGTSITAAIALIGVLLGGWLSLHNQDRLWRRDHARQWRDIRLAAYKDFVVASRAYVAYAAEPSAGVTAVPHPRVPNTSCLCLAQPAALTWNGWMPPRRHFALCRSSLGPSVPRERWWRAPGRSLLHEQHILIQNYQWRTL